VLTSDVMMTKLPVRRATNRARFAVARILVVDDHASSRSALGMLLGSEGFDVVLATSGHDAVQVLASRAVALLLSAVEIPNGDGVDLLEHLRQWYRVPVILMSAKAESAVLWKRGAPDGFVRMPIDFDHLLDVIANVMHVGVT
jgi:CheY-like chemotaxis protein